MVRTRRNAGRGLAAVCAVVTLALGARGAARTEVAAAAPVPVPPSVPSRVEEVRIRVVDRLGPSAVLAHVSSGYCDGDAYRPYIERVTLGWRRLGAARFRAVLTARVRSPVYPQPPTPPHSEASEGPAYLQACAGLYLDLLAKVQLPQPVGRTTFLDGSTNPPRRVPVFPHNS
ncbi:MAG TPA: hypothetical protein VGG40_10880 [Solirubrobacterales bacterium]|jgi:hypothetical protein